MGTTYRIGPATVRMHGTVNREAFKQHTIKFMKKVERARKEQRNEKK